VGINFERLNAMPSVDDLIQVRFISEQQGVQMQTSLIWQVVDLGTNPSIDVAMASLAAQYVDAFRAQLSIQWAITCVIYDNLTETIEPTFPVFVLEAGSEVTEGPHQTNNVVQVTRYAKKLLGNEIAHGSINIRGLHKNVSKAGRVESDMELGTLEAFLESVQTVPAGGWQLLPMLRYQLTPAPGATYDYAPITRAITQGVFRKLSRRSSSLCGSA